MVGIAIVCQPHIITKSLMLKSEQDINRYLFIAIAVEILFFAVLFVGFYARLQFPDLMVDQKAMKLDGILSTYVVKNFSIGVGILVVLGLISAGLSTLEGIIQSLSTTISNDIIAPMLRWNPGDKSVAITNKIVIVILGVISIAFSYQQLLYPNLSVGIIAQNGVYAYFSAAFVPVLFGVFLKEPSKNAAFSAAIVSIIVHFSVYYGGLTSYTSGDVRNPAVAAAIAIIAALITGLAFQFSFKQTKTSL